MHIQAPWQLIASASRSYRVLINISVLPTKTGKGLCPDPKPFIMRAIDEGPGREGWKRTAEYMTLSQVQCVVRLAPALPHGAHDMEERQQCGSVWLGNLARGVDCSTTWGFEAFLQVDMDASFSPHLQIMGQIKTPQNVSIF